MVLYLISESNVLLAVSFVSSAFCNAHLDCISLVDIANGLNFSTCEQTSPCTKRSD
jgi:hypothetical protein